MAYYPGKIQRAIVIATNTSALSVPASVATNITGWTTTTNALSAFNAATGVFTAPRTSLYRFSMSLSYASFASAANGAAFARLIGPATLSAFESFYAGEAFTTNISLNCAIELTAGQTVQLSTVQTSGVARALESGAGNNFLAINELASVL